MIIATPKRTSLKHLACFNPEQLPEWTNPDRLITYIDIGNVRTGSLVSQPTGYTFSSAPSRARRLVRQGDVIFSTVRPYLRAIYRFSSPTESVVSTGFAVIRPGSGIDSAFLFYSVVNEQFINSINAQAVGASYPAVDPSVLENQMVRVPPLDEQRAIARFLDRKSRRIARFIHARQRMIALLNEQKQAIIHQAVTRGLDPDIPLKPSGIDWLGDIPAHWNLIPSGRLMTGVGQGWSPIAGDEEDDGEQWSVLTLSAVKGGKFNPEARKPIPSSAPVRRDLEIQPGDVFLTRANTRQLVGDVALVGWAPPRLIYSDLIYRVRLDPSLILAPYFVSLMGSKVGRGYIEREARASNESMVKLAASRIRAWSLPVPPLHEQTDIESALERMRAEIEASIAKKRREIELLREYRTRLIADVVTGKLDIRGHPDAAEDAPEDLDDSESLDGILDGDVPVGDIEDDGPVDEVAG